MTSHQLELVSLGKVYQMEDMDTHALTDVNLVINKGDFVSISGPSGCGKSTLLSILGLLDTPTSGKYFIDGLCVDSLGMNQAAEVRNRNIGFIFQAFNLIDEITVFENVALPLHYRSEKITKNEIKKRVIDTLGAVGLGHRANHKPTLLSGGQQQRVAIARALVSDPMVLLVDEPTGNLDSKSGNDVMELLCELNREGTTVVMVTHDSRYANLAKRQLKLFDGELCSETTQERLAEGV